MFFHWHGTCHVLHGIRRMKKKSIELFHGSQTLVNKLCWRFTVVQMNRPVFHCNGQISPIFENLLDKIHVPDIRSLFKFIDRWLTPIQFLEIRWNSLKFVYWLIFKSNVSSSEKINKQMAIDKWIAPLICYSLKSQVDKFLI